MKRSILLSGCPRDFVLHPRSVAANEGNLIEHFVDAERIRMLRDGLIRNSLRLIVAIELFVSALQHSGRRKRPSG